MNFLLEVFNLFDLLVVLVFYNFELNALDCLLLLLNQKLNLFYCGGIIVERNLMNASKWLIFEQEFLNELVLLLIVIDLVNSRKFDNLVQHLDFAS